MNGAGKKLWGWYKAGVPPIWVPIQVDEYGRVIVDMSAITLNDLGDVDVVGATDRDMLVYNSATGYWEVQGWEDIAHRFTHEIDLGDLADTYLPAPGDQYFLYWDSDTNLWKCKSIDAIAVAAVEAAGLQLAAGKKIIIPNDGQIQLGKLAGAPYLFGGVVDSPSEVFIQPSEGNNYGELGIMPSGTTQIALLTLWNTSDYDNGGYAQLYIMGDDIQLGFGQHGTGIAPTNLIIYFTIDMTLHRISNLLSPAADKDAATKKYVDDEVAGVAKTKIVDADGDTKVDVEEAADEDMVRMDVKGVEAVVVHDDGIINYPKQSSFRAHREAFQSIPHDTNTKVEFTHEDYDPHGEYDNVTNYRFTAKRPGVYFFQSTIEFRDVTVGDFIVMYMFKNGAILGVMTYDDAVTAYHIAVGVTSDKANAGDYYEIWVRHKHGSPVDTGNLSTSCYFLGIKLT